MPKRKRAYQSNPQAETLEHLTHSKKTIQRALKLAKGFERQKLGKRLKLAQAKGEDTARINREITAWKGIELSEVAENYLYARIAKVKRFMDSGLLPEEVVRGRKEKEGMGEEERVALNNVTSGMCNTKCVKEALEEALKGLYLAMGIPIELGKAKGGKEKEKEKEKEIMPKGILKDSRRVEPAKLAEDSDGCEGLERDSMESDEEEGHDIEKDDEDVNSEDLSRYDALLGSSDSSSSDEDNNNRPQLTKRHPAQSKQLSLSLSPSPTTSPPPPSKRLKSKTKAPTTTTTAPKGTTFLPTLLGGYYSGSESASDLENFTPAPARKNRRGQMERRKIAEKKFGERAKHIQSGQPKASEMWKDKREAKSKSSRGRGGRAPPAFSRATGDNAIEVGGNVKKRGVGRKDDAGVLHPSWAAAKAAKETKMSATFMGKKVTFD